MSHLYSFDPCLDDRWSRFIGAQADASIFHSVGWLRALKETYHYQPIVFTTAPERTELQDGAVFCRISTWLSGRRLVSIPFSDHAAIFAGRNGFLGALYALLREELHNGSYKYVELRPPNSLSNCLLGKTDQYYWHRLSLDKDIDVIYRSFHKDCVQRKVRRAEREGLEYSEGQSEKQLQQFYRLMLITHRRHGIPPQPIEWFRNLLEFLGDAAEIRVASKNGVPVAAIITLTNNHRMVYKYGCSDSEHHKLGGMVFLFWQAIQDAKAAGLTELDLGRSDFENAGLISFKEHLGASRNLLQYWGLPAGMRPDQNRWHLRAVRAVFEHIPTAILPMTGRLLYRHMG